MYMYSNRLQNDNGLETEELQFKVLLFLWEATKKKDVTHHWSSMILKPQKKPVPIWYSLRVRKMLSVFDQWQWPSSTILAPIKAAVGKTISLQFLLKIWEIKTRDACFRNHLFFDGQIILVSSCMTDGVQAVLNGRFLLSTLKLTAVHSTIGSAETTLICDLPLSVLRDSPYVVVVSAGIAMGGETGSIKKMPCFLYLSSGLLQNKYWIWKKIWWA